MTMWEIAAGVPPGPMAPQCFIPACFRFVLFPCAELEFGVPGGGFIH
ncbi:MAG: hypothetical protein HGB36_02580 [Chlorobiaceae bacterium]|nr:hypothetical protein [Chlorobiaceae bacterium]